MKNKTILITGGAGFVGSHLIDRLLGEDNRVVCVDNFCTGSRHNIKAHLKNPNFALLEHDINQPLDTKEKIDEIYNLASPASPIKYQEDPVFTLTTNVVGTKNMLDLAVQHKAPLLQASTSEVYGDPLEHPQKETYWGNVNPVGIRSCYDEGKRAAETLCFDYYREKGVEVRVVRIFNTYGPRMAQDDGRVISNFITQALKGDDLTVYGDGSHTRSFQYVDDLIEGIVRMMAQDDPGPVNLGNPVEFTIKELAEKVIELVSSDSKITYKELPNNDPQRRRPDISKANRLLNWKPQIPLEKGLNRTVSYFKGLQ